MIMAEMPLSLCRVVSESPTLYGSCAIKFVSVREKVIVLHRDVYVSRSHCIGFEPAETVGSFRLHLPQLKLFHFAQSKEV